MPRRDPRVVLKGGERVQQGGGEDAAEIGDHRRDRRRRHARESVSKAPAPSPPVPGSRAPRRPDRRRRWPTRRRRSRRRRSAARPVVGEVELEADPPRAAVGPYSVESSGSASCVNESASPIAPATTRHRGRWPRRAQRGDRQHAAVAEAGRQHAHRVELVPVELAAEGPGGFGGRADRSIASNASGSQSNRSVSPVGAWNSSVSASAIAITRADLRGRSLTSCAVPS